MPTGCHMGSSEMTKKGALKQILLFPVCWPGESCLPQKQQLSWVVWDSGTGTLLRLGAVVCNSRGRAVGGQERSQGTCDCTDRLLFCLVERERSGCLGIPGWGLLWVFLKARRVSAAIPEPLAACGEVTWAAHWERAQSHEGSSVASWVTTKLKSWIKGRKYKTGDCGFLDV